MISLQSFSKSCINIRVCKEETKGQVQMFWWGDGFSSPWESFSYLITQIAHFYLKSCLHLKKSAVCRQGLNQPEHSLQKSKTICFQVQGNVRTRLLLPASLENLIFKKSPGYSTASLWICLQLSLLLFWESRYWNSKPKTWTWFYVFNDYS